eukprot:gene3094-600_t
MSSLSMRPLSDVTNMLSRRGSSGTLQKPAFRGTAGTMSAPADRFLRPTPSPAGTPRPVPGFPLSAIHQSDHPEASV